MDYLKNEFESLLHVVDDSVIETTVRHIFRNGKDICKEYFGEEDEECIKHNALSS